MRLIILLLFASFLYSSDSDFDGILDINDKCQNSSFKYIIDSDGCTDDKLYHGNLNLEYNHKMMQDDSSNLYQIDYSYNNYLISTYHISDIDSVAIGYRYNDSKAYLGHNSINDFVSLDYNPDTIFSSNLSYFLDDKNYLSYSISAFYNGFMMSYINSGSVSKFTNEYQDIDLYYTHYLDDIYLKIGTTKSLDDSTLDSLYFGIGVNFE